MNDKELIGKVHSSVYHQCQQRGYAAPVDVLMEIGVLPKQNMRTGGSGGRLPGTGLYRQSAQALVYYAPDAGVCTENRLKAIILLLQTVGRKKEKWSGSQAGDSAAIQQNRKS